MSIELQMITEKNRVRCEFIADHPEFRSLDSIDGIAIDLRYASKNNFAQRNLYGSLNCRYLHADAALGLDAAVKWLAIEHPEYRLIVLDALRPHRVQNMLWEQLESTSLRKYLADPARGSIHSFGMAVDVSLIDSSGKQLDMGTAYDDMNDLSHPALEDAYFAKGVLSKAQINNRLVLRTAMLDSGFHGIGTEWWHFDFGNTEVIRQTYTRIE